jgi:N-acetyl-gamma-glutamylphosphate reductase
MIQIACSSDPEIRRLLARHPRVERIEEGGSAGIEFREGGRHREVRIGDSACEAAGLVELMDNNPLVCAEVASVPSPAATLALIALGPAAAAGLISDLPAIIVNIPADADDVSRFLALAGWPGGVTVHVEPHDLQGVGTVAAMASIWTPERPEDVADLFDERFGRSFFVRRDEESLWDPVLVRGTPYACYRLSLGLDTGQTLLTVRCLADEVGKLGSAQAVHAMNIMCGFEEYLGLA